MIFIPPFAVAISIALPPVPSEIRSNLWVPVLLVLIERTVNTPLAKSCVKNELAASALISKLLLVDVRAPLSACNLIPFSVVSI